MSEYEDAMNKLDAAIEDVRKRMVKHGIASVMIYADNPSPEKIVATLERMLFHAKRRLLETTPVLPQPSK